MPAVAAALVGAIGHQLVAADLAQQERRLEREAERAAWLGLEAAAQYLSRVLGHVGTIHGLGSMLRLGQLSGPDMQVEALERHLSELTREVRSDILQVP